MILLSEAHFYVLKLTKWPEIVNEHKIFCILHVVSGLNFSRNVLGP